MAELTEAQRATLTAFCDTVVPSVAREDDPDGFWARKASDLDVAQGVEQVLGGMDAPIRDGLLQLLDLLARQGFERAPSQLSREQLLRNMSWASGPAQQGLGALTAITLFLFYGAPDPATGVNPNWATFGYGGPHGPPPDVPKEIPVHVPAPDGEELEADVCVVGSGAGGGVIAGTLARQGLKVVVLEAAGYFNEADFAGLELPAYQEMYWRGGPTPTADGNISLQAGTTLGGGTTINWTNCLRTTPWVRAQWAGEFGLEGVDGPEYDRHLDTVLERIGATDQASDLNKPQERMREGAERLGWSFKKCVRNTDLEKYSPETAGFLGFGDPSGAKMSTEKTFLRDAAAHDAEVLVRCHADRILVEGGRAAGVEATWVDPASGRRAPVTVRAPRVVVACGALESPALLQRSGIGGPAVGRHLRLHPCTALFGYYAEDQEAWWGAPHAALVDEWADVAEGYGFLIEGAQYTTGVAGSALPWTSGEAHKEVLARFRHGVSFIALTRDHGSGRVETGPDGEAVPWYSVEDPLDVAHLKLGIEKIARLHEAAGALEVFHLAAGMPRWRRGDRLEDFVAKAQRAPLRAGGARLFSAHQMGSCRMGTDPRESVANPWGELHDVPGVWIGDGSAFPTPSGTNPMVSIMALAHRTAEAIAGVRDEAAVAAAS